MESAPILSLVDDTICMIMIYTGDFRWAYNLSCTCRRMAAAYRARWELLRNALLVQRSQGWTNPITLHRQGPWRADSISGFYSFHRLDGRVIKSFGGALHSEEWHVSGMRHGCQRLFHGDRIVSETAWSRNRLNGRCFIEFPNGSRLLEITYEDGVPHGEFVDHLSSGYIVAGSFAAGSLHDALSMISPNGDLAWRKRFHHDDERASMVYDTRALGFYGWKRAFWDPCDWADNNNSDAIVDAFRAQVNFLRGAGPYFF